MALHDPTSLKIRRLTQALLISGILNVSVLGFLSYWVMRERPPTPYFELRPATEEQQAKPLADYRNCEEVFKTFQRLTFEQLLEQVKQSVLVENGYTRRDLALAYLAAFHHFDITRALLGYPQPQQRLFTWKNEKGESYPLIVYLGLTDVQFKDILYFAKTEQWPITSKGLFLKLQEQSKRNHIEKSLMEAFMLTPEFLNVELLFSRVGYKPSKKELTHMILEGDWSILHQFHTQQKKANDLSLARCQTFLLDYINQGSKVAAYTLLKLDGEWAIKKLDDVQVVKILKLLTLKTAESEKFAAELLKSPRSTQVWQEASVKLYHYAGEDVPSKWNYQATLERFFPNQKDPVAQLSKPIIMAKVNDESKPVKINKDFNANQVVTSSKPLTTPVAKKSKTNSIVKPLSYSLYIVQEGDSLWKISRRFLCSFRSQRVPRPRLPQPSSW